MVGEGNLATATGHERIWSASFGDTTIRSRLSARAISDAKAGIRPTSNAREPAGLPCFIPSPA
jgi:hypothetical protein